MFTCSRFQIDAQVHPSTATNSKLKWTSSKKSVATVDENGKVSAVGTHEELACIPGLYKDLWDIQGALEDEFIEMARKMTGGKNYV